MLHPFVTQGPSYVALSMLIWCLFGAMCARRRGTRTSRCAAAGLVAGCGAVVVAHVAGVVALHDVPDPPRTLAGCTLSGVVVAAAIPTTRHAALRALAWEAELVAGGKIGLGPFDPVAADEHAARLRAMAGGPRGR